MKKQLILALLLISSAVPAMGQTDQRENEPRLTKEEQEMAEAALRILRAEGKAKGRKPAPKRLQDKMNSSFPAPDANEAPRER